MARRLGSYEIDRMKAEILLGGMMDDKSMPDSMKERIVGILLKSGFQKEELQYYFEHRRWPKETDYGPEVKVTPARKRKAQINLLFALLTIVVLMFAGFFFMLVGSDEPKKQTETPSIEQPAGPVEEGTTL